MSNLMTSDLIRLTRQLAQGNARSPINILEAEKLDNVPEAQLTYSFQGMQVGMVVEIGWVQYIVVDVNVTDRMLTLLPEVEGTEITHPVGSRVLLRPRYPARRIIDELNNDLMDLSGQGIYKLRTVEGVSGVVTLPEDAVTVLDVWSDDVTPKRLPGSEFRISDTTVGPVLATDSTIGRAVFGCTLGQLPYDSDVDLDTVGLVSTAEDLPPMGAAMRLLIGAEAQRNLIDAQGDTRRAEEVPPGAITGAVRNLAAVRQQRIVTEAQRFQQRYGMMKYRAI
jgi:hypothetical protein